MEFDYHSVVERFANCGTAPQRSEALRTALSEHNLQTIAYLADNAPGLTDAGPYISVTYSDAWIDHYRRSDFVRIDPVLKVGLRSMLPTDWRQFDLSQRPVATLFGESRDAGLGRNGLSIPLRGRAGDSGVLSITTADSDRDWDANLQIYMRDFMIFAVHLHQSITEAAAVEYSRPGLSLREVECLKWAAAGKTHADIATILTISHHTAKAHLDTARHKLNALNLPHAVEQAFSLGIIRRGRQFPFQGSANAAE